MADDSVKDDRPVAPDSMTETITIEAHMTPAQMGREIAKVAKLMNYLVARMLLGNSLQGVGMAHPLAQALVGCATAAGQACAMTSEQNKILLPGGPAPHPGQGFRA